MLKVAFSSVGVFALAFAAMPESPGARASAPAPGATAPAAKRVAHLPVRFEPNVGQADRRARFVGHGAGVTAWLAEDGAHLTLGRAQATLGLRVVGAPPTAPVVAGRLATRSSYFLGNDPSRWRTDVPSFARVVYPSVAPGVDQVFHGESGAFEYDFVVAPGAKPTGIEVAFDGADGLSVDAHGALRIAVAGGVLVQPRARVYQRIDGHETLVACDYRVTGPHTAAFDVGAYDHRAPLVIDPVLAYSTFLGGSGSDYGYGVAVDASGAMYVTGFTTSPDFPTKDPLQGSLSGSGDAFVAKLTPDGTDLVFATYIGGSDGAYGYGIAVDAHGSAYVVGSTDSPDFPLVGALQKGPGGHLDAFAAKLSPKGDALVYSTYLGGAEEDAAYGVALDAEGRAFLVGSTHSTNFPTHPGIQSGFGGTVDAFVAEIDASGAALLYSTFMGGSQDDEGRGIAVDASGAAYVTGYTSSPNFPMVTGATPLQALNNGSTNAFVAKIAPSGASLAYATYLGGSASDLARAIAVDDQGSAYVTGSATSADFPTTTGVVQSALASPAAPANAFVAKLDPAGASLVYGTYLGGTGGDYAESIAVDAAGHAFLAGYTASTDFPTKDAVQGENLAAANAGGTNAFVTELSANATSLVFSTYLGGSAGDSAEAIALGSSGGAYVTGYTVSTDFPTVAAEQPRLASSAEDNAFVAVIGATGLDGDAGVLRAPFDAGQGGAAVDATGPPISSTATDAGDATSSVSGNGCSIVGSDRRGGSGGWGALGVMGLLALRRRRRVAFAASLP